MFSFPVLHAVVKLILVPIFFVASYILALKLDFVNLLRLVVVTKPVITIISFSMSLTFVSRVDLVARLVTWGILFSISLAFVLRLVLIIRIRNNNQN